MDESRTEVLPPRSTGVGLDALTRNDFPVLSQKLYNRWPLVYLDNAASTHRPLAVLEAMEQFERTSYSNVHRGNHWLSEEASAGFEQARETISQFIHAPDPRGVVFTPGTTAGINLVAHAWGNARLEAGDEILVTVADHHSNLVPWQQLAARTGARIVWYDHDIEQGIDVDRWSSLFTSRTRLATWPAVSNVLGFRAPTAAMVAIARSWGVTTLVDAAQQVPHEPTDVQQWNADFVVFSGHKMAGPTGIGVLYGRPELLDRMEPFLGGGSMIGTVGRDGFTPAPVPARFEAGTPPIVQAIGLAAAARYLMSLGLERIHAHEQELTRAAMQQLSAIPGLRILGPTADQRAGLISFSCEGVNSQDLGKLLDLRGIATRAGHHCAMPLHQHLGLANSLRASFWIYNSLAEVGLLAEGLASALAKLR